MQKWQCVCVIGLFDFFYLTHWKTLGAAHRQWLWAPSVLKFLSQVHSAAAASAAKPQEYQPAVGHNSTDSSSFLLFLPSSPHTIPRSCHPCSLADTQQAPLLRLHCWHPGSACFYFFFLPPLCLERAGGGRELGTEWKIKGMNLNDFLETKEVGKNLLYPPTFPLPPPSAALHLPPVSASTTYRLSARKQPVFTGFASHWLW